MGRASILFACVLGLAGCSAADTRGQVEREAIEGLDRRISISDLEGVQAPEGITTAALGRRKADAEVEVFPGVEVITRCQSKACFDGLVVDGRVIIQPAASKDDLEILKSQGAWLERVIRVTWADERAVSIYLAQSSFSGGAHANNTLMCRTFRRDLMRPLVVTHFVPRAYQAEFLERVHTLFDDKTALEVLGRSLDAASFELDSQDFRLGRGPDWYGARPEVFLCARGPYPSRSEELMELAVEDLPVAYLLGAPASAEGAARRLAPITGIEGCQRKKVRFPMPDPDPEVAHVTHAWPHWQWPSVYLEPETAFLLRIDQIVDPLVVLDTIMVSGGTKVGSWHHLEWRIAACVIEQDEGAQGGYTTVVFQSAEPLEASGYNWIVASPKAPVFKALHPGLTTTNRHAGGVFIVGGGENPIGGQPKLPVTIPDALRVGRDPAHLYAALRNAKEAFVMIREWGDLRVLPEADAALKKRFEEWHSIKGNRVPAWPVGP